MRTSPSLRQLIAVLAAPFAVLLAASSHGVAADPAPERLEYNRDVRPILADACFKCHGPDSAARKADLRLDRSAAAAEAGAIVPGKPDESEMIARIYSTDEELLMPPASSHKVLTDAQKDLLRRWVAQGAEYQPHWSLIPPRRPELPAVQDQAWVRNPIDAFVLARLESSGLTPAPEADRRTIARRVSLDLTGLPPSPELVESFVADTSDGAYERLVDRLLESPQWGEHRGRYWLDYARYADTHGIHFDNFREMWSYRDWVIAAFNRNLPWDEFTIESLAGDLLPNATLDQRIGSGFNRCNMTTNEGGIIDEEYLVLYTRDRTETVAKIWLGLTANCSTCHDHKFDPVTQREFYELAAFFNNTTQGARDGNIKDTPPIIAVPRPEDRPRFDELGGLIEAARGRVAARRDEARPQFDGWLAEATPELLAGRQPIEGLRLRIPFDEGEGRVAHAQVGGSPRDLELSETAGWEAGPAGARAVSITKGGIAELADVGDFDLTQPFTSSAWIKVPANDSNGAIMGRMDKDNMHRGWDFWIEGRRVGMHLIHSWSDDALKVTSSQQVPANKWVHVAVVYDGSAKAAGVKVYIDGKPQPTNTQSDTLKSTTRTSVPLKIGQRNNSEPLSGVALHDLRLYDRALSAGEVDTLAGAARLQELLAKPAADRKAPEVAELFDWWLATFDVQHQQLGAEAAQLEREREDLRARGTIAHVMQEKTEAPSAFVLFRGDYDKRRDEVKPDTPDALPPFPEDLPRNRLGFARWLLRDDQPLTARVTVNRFWQEVFGAGIVRSSGDFGVAGELPSHPELLDWLAVDFRESGWDVRRLFKLMVMSNTYRQSALVTPEKLERDPENRLLARGPRFRMDAEMVRDYALAASGLLVPKIGGPSVKPYQPEGVWEAIAMNVSNTRSYQRDTGEGLYRRSLYTFWKRMAPPASMDIFNAPNREFCVVRRERTNTPLQALATLNDEQYIEAARSLAQRAIQVADADEPRIQWIAARLLARPLREQELPVVLESLAGLRAHYQGAEADAAQLVKVGELAPLADCDPAEVATWTMLANMLLNLDEVLNK